MPATWQDLINDPEHAQRVGVLVGSAKTPAGAVLNLRVAEETLVTKASDTPAHQRYDTGLIGASRLLRASVPRSAEGPGDAAPIFGGLVRPDSTALMTVRNLDGAYDDWRNYSIDGRAFTYYLAGWYRGEWIPWAEVLANPLWTGSGVSSPQVSDTEMVLHLAADSRGLDTVLQPQRFGPDCLEWSPAGTAVNFGDVGDLTGNYTIEGWVYLYDPGTVGTLISKDTGTAGWSVAVGTASAGSVRALCREHSITTLDSAADLLLPRAWFHVAVEYTSGAPGTRRILINGTQVATQSVTGNPTNNTANLLVGGPWGRLSQWRIWSTARGALIRSEMFKVMVGNEAGLVAHAPMSEGSGATTRETVSSTTVALPAAAAWITSSWIGNVAGEYRAQALGQVYDAPLVARDVATNLFEASIGPVIVQRVSDNANPLAGASYAPDSARGYVTIVDPVIGRPTVDQAWSPFWTAPYFDGVSGYASATITCPAGSMALEVMIRPTNQDALTTRYIAGWRNASGAGGRNLAFTAGGAPNRLAWSVRNDAGTIFQLIYEPGLPALDRWYAIAGTIDVAAGQSRLYVDGALVGTAAVSGTFNTVLTAFTVARRMDGADGFTAAGIDDVRISSVALSAADAEAACLRPVTSRTGLAHRWGFDDASATTANSVGATALTLTGTYVWGVGRMAAVDLVRYLLGRGGYADATYDTASWAASLRARPGDCGELVKDGATIGAVLHRILQPLGLLLVRAPMSGLWTLSPWAAPLGAPVHRARVLFGATGTPALVPQAPMPAVSRVEVYFQRNNSVFQSEDVAGLITSDPARWDFATREWRNEPRIDAAVLADYPAAKAVQVYTPLVSRIWAGALADELRATYRLPGTMYAYSSPPPPGTVFPSQEIEVAAVSLLQDGSRLPRLGTPDNVLVVVAEIGHFDAAITVWRPHPDA